MAFSEAEKVKTPELRILARAWEEGGLSDGQKVAAAIAVSVALRAAHSIIASYGHPGSQIVCQEKISADLAGQKSALLHELTNNDRGLGVSSDVASQIADAFVNELTKGRAMGRAG